MLPHGMANGGMDQPNAIQVPWCAAECVPLTRASSAKVAPGGRCGRQTSKLQTASDGAGCSRLVHAASARILLPRTAMSRYSPLDSARDDTRNRGVGRDRPRDAPSDREVRDPRDVLSKDLDLPRHAQRQRVRVHDRVYARRESEVRTLAAVGAFRIVDTRDLADDARHTRRDLQHLRDLGLLDSVGAQLRDGVRASAVVLTREGKQLLEAHRVPRGGGPPQAYYAGLAKPREALHDAQL